MRVLERSRWSDSARKALTLLSILLPTRPLVGPVRLTVEITTACNFACLMCPFHSSIAGHAKRVGTTYMDTRLATRLIASAANLGTKIVCLVGRGETLLHPDFTDLVRLAASRGLQAEAITNGSLLTERRAEEIVDAGLSVLVVSLVAPAPEQYAMYHDGTPFQTFQRVLDSLALLQRVKRRKDVRHPKLELRFIAMKGTYLDVAKMVKLGIELGADAVSIQPLRDRSVGQIGTFALDLAEERTFVESLRQLAPEAARAGVWTNLPEAELLHRFGPVSHLYPCYAGWFDTRVLVDGSVTFCCRCNWTVGNLNERPLGDIWLGGEYKALRNIAMNPSERSRKEDCDCARCSHFHSNWQLSHFLSALRLAPGIEGLARQRS